MNYSINKRIYALLFTLCFITNLFSQSVISTYAQESASKTITNFTIDAAKTEKRYPLHTPVTKEQIFLTVTYSDTTTETICAANLENITIAPEDTDKTLETVTAQYGIYNINVTYGNITQNFGIMVVPETVTGLQQSSATTDTVTLSWNESSLPTAANPNNYQLGYQIMAYKASENDWTNYIYGGPTRENLPSTTTSYTLKAEKIAEHNAVSTDITKNKYKIRSFYKVYYSDTTNLPANLQSAVKEDESNRKYIACYSNRSTETQIALVPQAPSNLTVTSVQTNSVTLKWDAAVNASGYCIYRTTTDASQTTSNFTEIAKTKELQFEDTTVAASTRYQYKVAAYSEYQDALNQTTMHQLYGADSEVVSTATTNSSGHTPLKEITIDKKQSKYKYTKNEPFSGEGIIVTAHYYDGSTKVLSKDDYTLSPKATETAKTLDEITNSYGTHKIHVEYTGTEISAEEKAAGVNGKNYEIYVYPEAVQNARQTAATKDSVTLSWDALEGVSGYQVVEFNPATNQYDIELYGGPKNNNIPADKTSVTLKNNSKSTTFNNKFTEGNQYRFVVRAFYKDFNDTGATDSQGRTYRNFDGAMSNEITAATLPANLSGLTFENNTTTSISLRWNAVANADGYVIYGCKDGDSVYQEIAHVTNGATTIYTCNNLLEGTIYSVKAAAYKGDKTFTSTVCQPIKMMTKCKATTLSITKTESSSVTLQWQKIEGVDGYHIYQKAKDGNYKLVETITKAATISKTLTGLQAGSTYSFKLCAYKDITNNINGVDYTTSYNGEDSNEISATLKKAAATSTKAALYSTKAKFTQSPAYQKFTFFKKYLNYKNSIIIPGLKNTNVAGTECKSMQAKSITFMDKYLLISAADYKQKQNSVIYVVDKNTKKYVTTICLKDRANVNAIAYDGKHVWVSNGSYMAALSAAKIKSAAKNKKTYYTLSYETKCKVKTSKPAFATFYGDKLWVGASAKSGKSKVYSYSIQNKTSTTPQLIAKSKLNLPSKVTGIAFSDQKLYVSCSYGAKKTTSGYTHSLEAYPILKYNSEIGKVTLGAKQKSISVPTLNTAVAVSGKYLYVCFSSANVPKAYAPVDRICAMNWR